MPKLKVPSQLSFNGHISPSPAVMTAMTWGDEESVVGLPVETVSRRGTISNRLKPAVAKDPLKLNHEIAKANLQLVDTCNLPENKDTVRTSFTLKFVGGVGIPHSCNEPDFEALLSERVNAYIDTYGFEELGFRYACTIASGIWMWRNHVNAMDMIVKVSVLGDDSKQWVFDNALDGGFDDFSARDNNAIKAMASLIAKHLAARKGNICFKVTSDTLLGEGQPVFPSQEMNLDAVDKVKSKELFQMAGNAAFHDVKIGNAIRRIDTWYPSFATDEGVGPIPVEQYGPVQAQSKAFRSPGTKQDFYTLFDGWTVGEKERSESELHYMMAVLTKGGVFV